MLNSQLQRVLQATTFKMSQCSNKGMVYFRKKHAYNNKERVSNYVILIFLSGPIETNFDF